MVYELFLNHYKIPELILITLLLPIGNIDRLVV